MKNTNFQIPRWSNLPDIGLYMDQVIKYINMSFEKDAEMFSFNPITKSMINNYVKGKIVDPPENKQYSRKSIAMIIVIYLLKNCYSTDEIDALIKKGLAEDNYEETYDRFCEAVENAFKAVFEGNICIKKEDGISRENKYLMDNFALSLACKFYVKKSFKE